MATSFEQLKRSVIELVADTVVEGPPIEAGQLSARLLLDGVAAALTAICQKAPKHGVAVIGGAVDSFDLPEGLYEISGVKDLSTGLFLERMNFVANVSSAQGVQWTDFPQGKITFSQALSTYGATLFYDALWDFPGPTDYDNPDDFVLDVPQYLFLPVCLYTASYCAIKRFSESAEIRQFATKVDSGDPIDNPFQVLSDFLLRRFEVEIGRLQQRQRGSY